MQNRCAAAGSAGTSRVHVNTCMHQSYIAVKSPSSSVKSISSFSVIKKTLSFKSALTRCGLMCATPYHTTLYKSCTASVQFDTYT